VTLTLHAPTALGHFAGDSPLFGQVLVDLLARLVAHHLRGEQAGVAIGLLTQLVLPPSTPPAPRCSRSRGGAGAAGLLAQLT